MPPRGQRTAFSVGVERACSRSIVDINHGIANADALTADGDCLLQDQHRARQVAARRGERRRVAVQTSDDALADTKASRTEDQIETPRRAVGRVVDDANHSLYVAAAKIATIKTGRQLSVRGRSVEQTPNEQSCLPFG